MPHFRRSISVVRLSQPGTMVDLAEAYFSIGDPVKACAAYLAGFEHSAANPNGRPQMQAIVQVACPMRFMPNPKTKRCPRGFVRLGKPFSAPGKSCFTLSTFRRSFLRLWSFAQDAGALRGRVMDGDFGLPLADARIAVSELDRSTQSGSDGNWILNDVPRVCTRSSSPRLDLSKIFGVTWWFVRAPPSDVNFELMGQFDDQEEFVVEEVETVGGTELGLLRAESGKPCSP